MEYVLTTIYCTAHREYKALWIRDSMADDDPVFMCDKCRDRLIDLFKEDILVTLNVEVLNHGT